MTDTTSGEFAAAYTRASTPPKLRLEDIQGNLLRGYRAARARHFMLAIGNRRAASAFLGAIAPHASGPWPKVRTEEHWNDERARTYLNVGITCDGLRALGLPEGIIGAFPSAFRGGPARHDVQGSPAFRRDIDVAAAVGDTGPGSPDAWLFGRPGGDPVHVVVSLYGGKAPKYEGHPGTNREDHDADIEAATTELRALFEGHALVETFVQDAAALPNGMVHFGYHDGIGQPRIDGAPGRQPPDGQDPAMTGDFLLGCDYVNHASGNHRGDLPPALADNGTYGAMRMMEQDVEAFEQLLDRIADEAHITRELAAAKLLGRWRGGAPLSVAPDAPHHELQDLDEFDFVPGNVRGAVDDSRGERCPIGAHIRRLNPRSSHVMGQTPLHRIVRRGMAYGPPYHRENPGKPTPRGLIGYFLCGDLEMQFELILSAWANADYSRTGLRGTVDPFLGARPEKPTSFVIPRSGAPPIVIRDLPRLVITRGTVYAFIPGIGGLRYLATRAWEDGGPSDGHTTSMTI